MITCICLWLTYKSIYKWRGSSGLQFHRQWDSKVTEWLSQGIWHPLFTSSLELLIVAQQLGVHYFSSNQCPGRFFGIIGWDPNVSKSNRLYVDTFLGFSPNLGYILQFSPKWWVMHFNHLFLKLNWLICNYPKPWAFKSMIMWFFWFFDFDFYFGGQWFRT